jgi:hypothetical protein
MSFSHTAKPVGLVLGAGVGAAGLTAGAGLAAGATSGVGPFDGAAFSPGGVHEIAVIAHATATTPTPRNTPDPRIVIVVSFFRTDAAFPSWLVVCP